MATRKRAPSPLDLVRSDVTKHAKDIVALKARMVAVEQRLAKAETALGTVAKGEMPPNVEREETRDEALSAEARERGKPTGGRAMPDETRSDET